MNHRTTDLQMEPEEAPFGNALDLTIDYEVSADGEISALVYDSCTGERIPSLLYDMLLPRIKRQVLLAEVTDATLRG